MGDTSPRPEEKQQQVEVPSNPPLTIQMMQQMMHTFLYEQRNSIQQEIQTALRAAAPSNLPMQPSNIVVPPNPLTKPLPPSIKIAKPSLYNGNTVTATLAETWIFAMEQYQTTCGATSDEQRIAVATTFLRDAALTWWIAICRTHTIDSPVRTNWASFRSAFLERFQPVAATRAARFKLKDIQQGKQSVAEFSNRFQSLVQQISDMSEKDQIETYVRGLRNAIAKEVDMKDPSTLQDAMLYAARVEILLDNRQRRNSFPQSSFYSPYYSSPRPVSTSIPSNNESTPMELGNASLAAIDTAVETASDGMDGVDMDTEYERFQEMGLDEYEPSVELNIIYERIDAENEQLKAIQQPDRAPPMSREEFSRCMRLRLCLRCKKPNHVARYCPLRPKPQQPQQSQKRNF
ncbi:MAG: retrotransposon gag family protein [Rhabdochlamydiaceae bacterium]